MNKLDKPSFKLSILNNISLVFTVAPSFVTLLFSTWYYALIVLLFTIIVTLAYDIFKYIKLINKFYNNYIQQHNEFIETQNNHTALAKQFEQKNKIIKEKDILIDEYKFIINNIVYDIHLGTLEITNFEKNFLNNLYKTLHSDKEHLYKLEWRK